MRNILVGVPITYLFTHQPLYQRNKIWCDFKVRCKLEWESCWRVCFYGCKALRTSFQILSFPKCWCILRALEKFGHLFWYLEVRGQMFSNISFSQELLWKRCPLHVPEWWFRGRMCTLLAQTECMSEQGLWICCSWAFVQSRIWLVNHYDCLSSCAGKEPHWEQGFGFSAMLFTLRRSLGFCIFHLGFKAAVFSDTK